LPLPYGSSSHFAAISGAKEARQCLARLMELQPGLTVATFTAHPETFLSAAVTEIFVEGRRKAGLPE
jgi:hypothetical protein